MFQVELTSSFTISIFLHIPNFLHMLFNHNEYLSVNYHSAGEDLRAARVNDLKE